MPRRHVFSELTAEHRTAIAFLSYWKIEGSKNELLESQTALLERQTELLEGHFELLDAHSAAKNV